MFRCVPIWVATILVAGNAGWANGADAPAPWHIGKVSVHSEARPGAADEPQKGVSLRYLHVHLSSPFKPGELKLHDFRIVDARGATVAEIYGFHKDRALLVFEGDWSKLGGLSLDGGGHREPLVPDTASHSPPSSQPRGPNSNASELPAVMARSASRPTASEKKAAAVEPAAPTASPQSPEEPAVHAKQDRHVPGPSVQQPPQAPRKLYQEVVVTQRSRYRMQGIDVEADLQYRVLSSLTAGKPKSDGSRVISQKVEQAQLLRADALTQPVFTGLLNQLVGTTFAITVNAEGDVTGLEGAKGRIRASAGNDTAANPSLVMASIIDPDGWREIAQLTFFRPPSGTGSGEKWERSVTHSWGPLGRWSGRATYARTDKDGPLERVCYELKLDYQPPKPGAGGLPFTVLRSDFRHQGAGGSIEYDRAKGRTARAAEHFPVKGNLTVGLLGQETAVELDESQDFQVRILDEKPVYAGR
jgi:hypothetical protein